MATLGEAAVQALELDSFAKNIGDLVFSMQTAYSYFKKNAQIIPAANITAAGGVSRNSIRAPFRVQGAGAISVGTGNADPMGRGTSSQYAGFAVQPIWIQSVTELSTLSLLATKGKDRGLVNLEADELKNSLDSAAQGIEGLVVGDGSGAVDNVVTVSNNSGSGPSTSYIVCNTAASFTDQQAVQFFPSEGGTSRGTVVITYVDPVAERLYFGTALPSTGGATQAGDYIMVNGASGAVGSSVLGVQAWDNNSATGTVGGINRALYPGRISTPTINLNGGSVTPGLGTRALVLLQRAMGKNAAKKEGSWIAGDSQALAVNNLYTNIQVTGLAASQLGDATPDIVKKDFAPTFGGRDIMFSSTFPQSRYDLIFPENWYMGELKELSLHDFGGGQTFIAVPDASQTSSGSYLNASMFAYETCFNLINSTPRFGVYITGAAVPTI